MAFVFPLFRPIFQPVCWPRCSVHFLWSLRLRGNGTTRRQLLIRQVLRRTNPSPAGHPRRNPLQHDHANSSPKKPASSAAKKTSSSKQVSDHAARQEEVRQSRRAPSPRSPCPQNQTGICGLQGTAANGAATGNDADAGGLLGRHVLCARAYRRSSAAAYLALGNAYYLDKRYTDAVASLHQARETGEALDGICGFPRGQGESRGQPGAGGRSVAKEFQRQVSGQHFVTMRFPRLEANVLLDLHDVPGASAFWIAAPAIPPPGVPDTSLPPEWWRRPEGRARRQSSIFKTLLLAYPLSMKLACASEAAGTGCGRVPHERPVTRTWRRLLQGRALRNAARSIAPWR